MINILVDEAYAFDYLAILSIKIANGVDVTKEFLSNYHVLNTQLGEELTNEIYVSDEYKELTEANEKVFDAVNKAKTNEVTAKYVDDCNYERMLAKKALQKKFFNTELTEKKVGYENG